MPKPNDETVLMILTILELLDKRESPEKVASRISHVGEGFAASPNQITSFPSFTRMAACSYGLL